MEKVCKRCGEIKSIDLFHINKPCPDGHEGRCKQCKSRRTSAMRYMRKHNLCFLNVPFPPEVKQCNKCKQLKPFSSFNKKLHSTCKYGLNTYCKSCISEYRKTTELVKIKQSVMLTLNKRMSDGMYHNLRSKESSKRSKSWKKLVPYTIDELKVRLQSTMPQGYTWDDFLQGKLHVDHITPKSSLRYDSPDHPNFKLIWSLKNLQLLPVIENMQKGSKLYWGNDETLDL